MTHINLAPHETDLLLDALNAARVEQARLWGQYTLTDNKELATHARAKLDSLSSLRDKIRAVWQDHSADAERLTIGREEDWREAAEDRMWKLHDEFEGARV